MLYTYAHMSGWIYAVVASFAGLFSFDRVSGGERCCRGSKKQCKWRSRCLPLVNWNHCGYQHGYTPLINAAMEGNLPVLEFLVERGADMEVKNEVCDTKDVKPLE